MKNYLGVFLTGVWIWLVPFAIGMAIFAFIPPETAFFESIMAISMAAAASFFSLRFLRKRGIDNAAAAAGYGVVWMVIAIILDAPWFLMMEQMKMPPADYATDIGIAYLMIPIIAAGIGAALNAKQ